MVFPPTVMLAVSGGLSWLDHHALDHHALDHYGFLRSF